MFSVATTPQSVPSSMAMAASAEWWQAAKEVIAAYTGLSPAAFITAMAVIAALYAAVSGSSARPAPPPPRRREAEEQRAPEPLPPPVQLGEVTEKELRVYDGSDPKKPLLMAIKGQIYDVTQSRMFYGPGGPYALFAGKDASRALAKMSFEPSDLTGDITGLSPLEVEALQEWEHKFMTKYVKAGTLNTVLVAEGSGTVQAVVSARGIDASTICSNHVLPEKIEATGGSAVEHPTKKSDVDASKCSHEDAVEKVNEFPDSHVRLKNTSEHEDAVEKQEKTPGDDIRNTSNNDAGESKWAIDEKKAINAEDAMEKPKEVPDADVQSSRNYEGAVEPREAPGVYEKNINIHQDAEEKLKETSD